VLGIAAVVGVLIVIAGGALIGAHLLLRDDDGYYTTDTETIESRGYAVASDAIELSDESVGFDADDLGASITVAASSAAGEPLFVGIGRHDEVARYLRGVGYSRLDDFGDGAPRYTQVPGGAPSSEPAQEDIWAAQAEGSGNQTVEWDVENGSWTAVVMNADASRGVSADAEAGVKIDWLIWVGLGILLVGLLIAGSCGYALARVRRDR
jgi:hypothetical protein